MTRLVLSGLLWGGPLQEPCLSRLPSSIAAGLLTIFFKLEKTFLTPGNDESRERTLERFEVRVLKLAFLAPNVPPDRVHGLHSAERAQRPAERGGPGLLLVRISRELSPSCAQVTFRQTSPRS